MAVMALLPVEMRVEVGWNPDYGCGITSIADNVCFPRLVVIFRSGGIGSGSDRDER